MTDHRPVFLNLLRIRWPMMAFTSGLHRISGVAMSFSLPLLVWAFDQSLRGEREFAQLSALLDGLGFRLLLVGLLWALAHHLLAGVRFLLIDLDIGVKRESATRSAWAVNLLSAAAFLTFAGALLS